MAEELLYRRQVSRQHLDVLAQFMERYPPLALASARSREGLIQSKRMWEKIARTLNKIDDSISKSGKSWARYWINLKFKVRHKYMCIKRCQSEGARCGVHLNPFEERIIKVLTDEEGNLLPPSSANCLYYKQPGRPLLCKNICIQKPLVTNQKPQVTDQKPTNNNENIDDSRDEDIPSDTNCFEDYLIPNGKATSLTEMVNIMEPDVKPNYNIRQDEDPIQILPDFRKSLEELKRELIEFELKKQKELFEIEKKERREKHELEVSILRLRKQILEKEFKS